jgi:hypothetical protein
MSQQQSATDQINGLLDQLSIEVTAAIGRIAAAWVYLETEFDLALECLLVHRNTEGLHDDYILIPFKSRLAVLRAAGKLVYPQPVFSEFERVLSKVANAYGKRNPVIHGRFTGIGGGSCSVETHRHTSKGGGPFRVTTRTYSIKQLAAISSEVVDAAGTFVAFNRKHLPGGPHPCSICVETPSANTALLGRSPINSKMESAAPPTEQPSNNNWQTRQSEVTNRAQKADEMGAS